MGGISELSDDLLVKILSYLPTKDAASTMILSKQWQFLWMWLPNLEFRSIYFFDPGFESDYERLRRFLLRNLPLHRSPVIDSFGLNLCNIGSIINLEDVKLWVQFAVSRDVRELEIYYNSNDGDDILPSSLYTCKSLVTLKLYEGISMDVPRMVCLPSLKTLRLENLSFSKNDSLPWLLSNCPVLEDLFLLWFSNEGKIIVRVPSLQRLSFKTILLLDEFVIDTPSLKYLKLDYYWGHTYISVKNMPKLKEAFLDVSFSLFAKLIGSIPSVKRLTLCLSFDDISEVVFDDWFVFNKLKHLKLCTCQNSSLNVLGKLLKVSPNLRVLELFTTIHDHIEHMHDWNQPNSVPECILSSLETFKWSKYHGSKEERELVIYILQNAHFLKTATIHISKFVLDKTLEIKKELELSSRASTTCQLLFH